MESRRDTARGRREKFGIIARIRVVIFEWVGSACVKYGSKKFWGGY